MRDLRHQLVLLLLLLLAAAAGASAAAPGEVHTRGIFARLRCLRAGEGRPAAALYQRAGGRREGRGSARCNHRGAERKKEILTFGSLTLESLCGVTDVLREVTPVLSWARGGAARGEIPTVVQGRTATAA